MMIAAPAPLKAALNRKREADAAFKAHCDSCAACAGPLCVYGRILDAMCDDARDALVREVRP